MAWIETIDNADAQGRLRKLYDAVQTPDGHVDNILRVHSLRPRTLRGHLELYKAALHSQPSGLSYRERELVGVCVSKTNGCNYCVQHHQAGLARDLGDAELAAELAAASVGEIESERITARELAMCAYARQLTEQPAAMAASDLAPLRAQGLDDAAILDLNQIVAYFAYANRTVNGLGVEIAGEPLGLHPDEEQESFAHG
jgi:uncharacterized peroxidase-related enzyme